MIKTTSVDGETRLAPRDPRGGRPPQDIAAKLGAHILDAAFEQFVRHGVEATSMEMIATAASVSKRTLYARFGSKMDLLIAVIDNGVAKHLKPISRAPAKGDTRERLVDLGSRFLDLALRPEAIGLEALMTWVAREQSGLRGVVHERGVEMAIAVFEEILEHGVRSEGLSIQDTPATAALFFDALVVVPRHRIMTRRQLDDVRSAKLAYLNATVDLLFAGLAPR